MSPVPRWFPLLVIAAPLGAQQVPVVTLSRPAAEFAEPLTEVRSIRELSDGRVIVVDSRELTVQLLDFASGTAQPIGRRGSGPGEYEWPQGLLALAGDTTAVIGASGGRLLLIHPDGKPGDLLDLNPPASGDRSAALGRRFNARYSDARGRFYSDAMPIRRFADGRPPELVDSSAILRLDRATQAHDTIGYFGVRSDPTRRLLPNGVVIQAPSVRAWTAEDAWAVGPDGRVAIVYQDPYHVVIIDATGRRVTGQPIPYQRVRVDNALKEQWRAEQARPQMAMRLTRGSSAPSIDLVKRPVQEPDEWPEFLPAFKSRRVLVAPDGVVWVERMTAANAPPEYDLIDGNGRLVQKVRLAPRSQVVGFGNGTVYVVRLDEDDLQYLQRYASPRL